MKIGKKNAVLSGIISSAVLIFTASSASAVPELASHQARYKMSLLSAEQDTQMTGLNGQVEFMLTQECQGWQSSEEYLLEFTYTNGDSALMVSYFKSWEDSDDGLYSFEVYEGSSFEPETQFQGFASIKAGAERPHAFFSQQPDNMVELPEDVTFPILHTQQILERAEKGERIFAANLFFGAEPEKALKRTNTVIGSPQPITDSAVADMISSDKYYPVQTAYFDPDSVAATPEYEITFHMQLNGIISYYEVDYGDFAIRSELVSLDAIAQPDCS